MLHFFWSIAAFVVVLGVLIVVHEFGHFWVARRCSVTVERFAIGFGPALWRWCDKRGTEYVIAAIPLGGYVKMLSDRVDSVAHEPREGVVDHKAVWQRAAIIAAGPVFNFLFAIAAYWIVFMIGVPTYRPVIGEIVPHSIASRADMSSGMELKSVNGIETPDWDSFRLELINSFGAVKTTICLVPFGSSQAERKTLDLRGWYCEPNKQDPIVSLGIIPLGPRIEAVLSAVQPGSAAVKAGLQAGDRIVKVNGKPFSAWQVFMNQVRDNPGQSLSVSIERNGRLLELTLWPDSKAVGRGHVQGFAGLIPKIIPLPAEYKTVLQYGPLTALAQATEKTCQLMRVTVNMLGKVVTGDVKINNLSGPIGIAKGAGMAVEYGWIYYLMFLALISVNVGVINLFPLPMLDGGHLLFLAIEKLQGEPVSKRVQDFSYRIGSILLVLLMGLALFNDFSRL
ncbi:sigma E protease regulator RseP [secondary endosymbiont of Ctenarytaina eucalypti]|uniref:Zinc metalloprotease n=1 Tax=secondary endosymbiont of Ctenarytaina eucalypti TaxID=1199245 RepID=J3TG26_9ENTR|nr:sigma E protease regulator RseP [secondary endosymbiont of Ctenarytaina eucalypti]AFP85307.1 RIP metalloprotease RseP [secondary endosymbiont of Ctenarytaina eucalypti]